MDDDKRWTSLVVDSTCRRRSLRTAPSVVIEQSLSVVDVDRLGDPMQQCSLVLFLTCA